MQLLGGDHREAFLEIEPHLVTKATCGARAGTVAFLNAGIYYMLNEI